MKLLHTMLLLALTACGAPAEQQPQNLPLQPLAIKKQDGTAVAFKVQVAQSTAEIQKGLMWVKSMHQNHGMLFIFPRAEVQTFWMKNTLIPLDMLFISAAGQVVHIHENAVPHDETPISSRFPVTMVLELNGGAAAHFGLQIGDRVVVAKAEKSD